MHIKLICIFLTVLSLNTLAATVDTVSVKSNSMNKNISCVVITPKNYKKAKINYPVVYLLHGYGGSYRSWVKDMPVIKEYSDLYKIILVCPDGGKGSWYLDSPVDSTFKYETFVSKELVPFIDGNYKTAADRKHRAITGYSMGGHGAFYLAIKHKDIFGAIASMSGGVDIRPFPERWDIKKRLGIQEQYKENWEKHTVINVVDSLKNKELAILFDCGIADFFIEVNRALNKKLLGMKVEHDYIERPGGHNKPYWTNAIAYHLLFFNKFFTSTLP